MTVVEILKKARAKVEKGWCQGADARIEGYWISADGLKLGYPYEWPAGEVKWRPATSVLPTEAPEDACFCARGALRAGACWEPESGGKEPPEYLKARWFLKKAIEPRYGLPFRHTSADDWIIGFNDSAGRTKQEVLEVFDAAIAAAEAEATMLDKSGAAEP